MSAADKTPQIAVPFADDADVAAIRKANEQGMDIAELRLDLFANHELAHVQQYFKNFAGISTILTIRAAAEGGNWRGGEDERLEMYRQLMPLVDMVDVELLSVIKDDVCNVARAQNKTCLLSFHDFEQTPPRSRIEELLHIAQESGADIFKLATKINSSHDLKLLAGFLLDHQEENLLVIGMGSSIARVFFPALGSLIVFASLGRQTAPGQLGLVETVGLVRRFYGESF